MKSSFHSRTLETQSLLSHLQLPSQETPSIIIQLAWDPRYIASEWTQH
jgi:hypothetical protein